MRFLRSATSVVNCVEFLRFQKKITKNWNKMLCKAERDKTKCGILFVVL
jgi:hypothetical protein